MNSTKKLALVLFTLPAAALAFFVLAQHSTAAQATGCNCDNLAACNPKPTPEPSKTPLRKPPLKPVKYQIRNIYKPDSAKPGDFVEMNQNVNEKALPGLDFGTGTAADTEYNYNIGRTNASGHFSERRRFVYNTYKLAEESVANGEITQENFSRLKTALESRLEEINRQEKEAYSEEGKAALQEFLNDLDTRVDKENAERAAQIEKEIEKMDLEQYDEKSAAIEQVLSENLAQARAQELLGGNGQGAFGRVVDIIAKLRNKIAADCDKQKITIQNVLGIERQYLLLGGAEDGAMNKCFSFTAIAKANFGGIEYEAEHCISITDKVNRESLAGDWMIKISGAMSGAGDASILANGGGNWSGNATVGGEALINMTGTAELVSQPTGCALRITSNMGVGSVAGYVTSMPGVGGNLPITILNRPCRAKKVEVPAK